MAPAVEIDNVTLFCGSLVNVTGEVFFHWGGGGGYVLGYNAFCAILIPIM